MYLFVARISTTITINIIKEWRRSGENWVASLSLICYVAYFLYHLKVNNDRLSDTNWQWYRIMVEYRPNTRRNFSTRNSNDEEESLTELSCERGSKIEFTTFRPAEFSPKARRSGSQQVFICIFYPLTRVKANILSW